MSLISELESTDKAGLFSNDINTVSYSTGFDVLDYANGYWSIGYDANGNPIQIKNLGLPAGSFVGVISETGGGKSTLSIQIGWNIISPYDNGLLYIVDCEKSNTWQRILNLCRCPIDEHRIKLNKAHTSIEEVQSVIKRICDAKEAGKREFMYKVENSYTGKPFWMYVPTVILIDALPKFNSKEYSIDDLGNADQMRAAKDVTRFYTNNIDRCYQYNIIVICINHIKPKANLDPYANPPRGLFMLNSKTETLPRGQASQYYSSTFFRLRSTKSNMYTVKDDGFTGVKVDLSLAKTKTNTVGTEFPITFNFARGFDNNYSLFEFAKSVGLVEGRNPFLRIIGAEPYKFDRKHFTTLMESDEGFRVAVMQAIMPYLEALMGAKDLSAGDTVIDINDLYEEEAA